tara:strand:+ start:10891 stop:11064 length:174 start_codon:yes stop_codon:yes gene_type:complete
MEDLKIIAGTVLIAVTFFVMGIIARQETMEERALKIEQKDCYNWQDIEIVLFGEIQE